MARLRPPPIVATLVAISIITWAPRIRAEGRQVFNELQTLEPSADPAEVSATETGRDPSASSEVSDDETAAAEESEASPSEAPIPDRGAQTVEIGTPLPAPEPEPSPSPVVEPPPPTDIGRPQEPRFGGRPATGKGLLIAGAATFAVGAAALVTTSLITLNCSYDGPLRCKYENQAEFLIPLSATPAVLGLVLLGVGGGYYARYKRWERWTPDPDRPQAVVVPAVNREGAGLAISGRF